MSFSGDADDTDGPAGEEVAIDMFGEALRAGADDEVERGDEEGDEDAEPEDDFNAAWEVLDLARAIYDRQGKDGEEDEEVKLKLADTYIALGDVSLETGSFSRSSHSLRFAGARTHLEASIFWQKNSTRLSLIIQPG